MAFLLLAVCAALAAIYGTQPPAAAPCDAAAAELSSDRAMEHVRRIGREPHPMGSPENAEVCAYVFGELGSLGLDEEIDRAVAWIPAKF